MPLNTNRILWTSLLALAAAGPAAAQSNGSEASFCQNGYVHADADDDGLVSNEELQTALAEEFGALDADQSGDLTIEEIEDCLNAGAGTQSMTSDRALDNLMEADQDEDEMLSSQEFMDAAQAAYDDVHSDPSISADSPEMQRLGRYVFIALDGADRAPSDMTRDEVAARSAQMFRNLDTNADEMIDASEWEQQDAMQRDLSSQINIQFSRMDSDRSGAVSEEEYTAARMEDVEAAREAALANAEGSGTDADGGADVPVVYYRYESTF
jgi:Ca2+-binding EF-hand superfamily protein